MRRRRALACAALFGVAGFYAGCSGDDAAPEAPTFDASAPEVTQVTLDAGGPLDDGGDAAVEDVVDAGFLPPGDAGLGTPELVGTIPGLVDFDFEGTTLVYQTAIGAGGIGRCTMPACTDMAVVPGLTTAGGTGFTVLGGQIYYPRGAATVEPDLERINFDGTGRTVVATSGYVGTGTVAAVHGGASNQSLVLRLVSATAGRFEYRIVQPAAAVPRDDRVGRANRNLHTNEDASIYYKPQDQPAAVRAATFTGTRNAGAFTMPLPPAAPDFVAVSPTVISTVVLVKSPIAVYSRAGAVFACPIPAAGNCAAWVATGATGARSITIDDQHLYVATAAGVGRCTLTAAAAGTCALSAVVSTGPVDHPMYLAGKTLYYRAGTAVHRVAMP